MLLVNQLNGFGAAGVPAVPISFTSVDTPAANTTSQTTYTFSSASFGSAASVRVIVVAFASRANTTGRTISSVTIGGVAATAAAVGNYSSGGASDFAAIYYAELPSGTTGDVVITFSAAMLRCALQVFRMTGQDSVTPSATATDTTGDPMDGDVNVVAGGAAVGVSATGGASGGTVWTGLTESTDTAIFGTHEWSTAFAEISAAETPRDISANIPASVTSQCLAVAAWA